MGESTPQTDDFVFNEIERKLEVAELK